MNEPTTSRQAVPCRLYVILAREAPIGVIFRRGPTKWVQLVKWHTDRDEFEEGQWFHGRIYERRCDLSPDGSLLIYFANKLAAGDRIDESYTYAWTAISKPPYFTALALWPKGDCWHGGGLFTSNSHVWLNHRPHVAIPHPDHKPRAVFVTPNPDACGEDAPVYYRRIARDGWAQVQEGSYDDSAAGEGITKQPEILERVGPDGATRLELRVEAIDFQTPGGPYIESFALRRPGAPGIPIGRARWADWDQAGRLVLAREGKLLAARVEGGGLVTTELIDLNPNVPRPVEPPEWARTWY
jgi:hypothetical protein